MIFALTEAPDSGWTSGPVVTTGLVGLASLALLVPAEQRRREPMLRTKLFRSRVFDAINVATLIFYGALAASGYLVVVQCELQLGYSATAAGAALIPESAVFLIVSPLVGGLVARIGTRWPMAAGILLVAGGFAWLSVAQRGSSYVETIVPPVTRLVSMTTSAQVTSLAADRSFARPRSDGHQDRACSNGSRTRAVSGA